MPETTQGQHLLRQVRTIVSIVLIIVIVFAVVGSVLLSKQSSNIDRNTTNIANLKHTVDHLESIVDTTAKDARRTRVALEKALKEAQTSSNPEFVKEIQEGLDAIKRIEAKLSAGGH